MSLLFKLINLLLYSNAWIALAATCSVWQSLLFISDAPISNFSYLLIFTFSSTLFIYAIHRIQGLQKVSAFKAKGRYLVISTFKSHIIIYAILGAVGAAISFLYLSWASKLSLIIPAFLSLGYVLPAFSRQRRLRDIHFLKIFLIAIVWTWVGVVLPALETNFSFEQQAIWWMMLEKLLFIFAVTLPFDIRDLAIDQHTNVKTIPALLGASKSKILAIASLVLMLVCCSLNVLSGLYQMQHFLAFVLHAILTGFVIYAADKDRHDYYFTGILDGTITLQFLMLHFTSLQM
ncbi:MAG: UbiA family prenyltransferase [Bacteroidota bacterium]